MNGTGPVGSFDCAATRGVAAELSLGLLSGAERVAALAHLEACASCQALVVELIDAADRLPLLAGEAEPPTGFEYRVLNAMTSTRRRRHLRPLVVAVAAAVVTAIIGSVVVARNLESGGVQHSVAAAPNPLGVRTASMIGAGAVLAGKVFVFGRDHPSVALTIDYAVPDGVYQLELRRGGAPGGRFGTVRIRDGRGSWTGTVRLPALSASSIVLLDRHDRIVCHADLTPPT